MPSGKLLWFFPIWSMQSFAHNILIDSKNGRLKFTAVRDPTATSRFQIGSIDFYSK